MKRGADGIFALIGIILVIALMCNPLLTGYFLVKAIELIVIMWVVNIVMRCFTGKTLLQLLKSLREERDES